MNKFMVTSDNNDDDDDDDNDDGDVDATVAMTMIEWSYPKFERARRHS